MKKGEGSKEEADEDRGKGHRRMRLKRWKSTEILRAHEDYYGEVGVALVMLGQDFRSTCETF